MRNRPAGLLVGITGGIGSGKSTVCGILRDRGRTVFSADEIGAHVSLHHSRVRSEIMRAFGTLDREELASVVFSNPRKLATLNRIIHPVVIREISRSIRSLPQRRRYPYVVVESALLFEAKLSGHFDFVVLVDAPLELRLKRRSGKTLTKAEIRRRARNQLPAPLKRRQADFVLSNRGSQRDLRSAVFLVDGILTRMAKKYRPEGR